MDKKKQLKKSKALATGLFLLMVVVYAFTTYLAKSNSHAWIGYVNAFSEAAMVGALADWFAVTALFHHPLGIAIPHTNIIEKSKQKIGDNLGSFVVENFLTAENLKPYILKIDAASYLAEFLKKEKNKNAVLKEIKTLLIDLIEKLDDKTVTLFLAKKGEELLKKIPTHDLLANGIQYLMKTNEQEKLVSLLASRIKNFVLENEDLVAEKVKKESYFFIPNFVDKKLAKKISSGLIRFFDEIENDPEHRVRKEINKEIDRFVLELREDPKRLASIALIRDQLLPSSTIETYAHSFWQHIKNLSLSSLEEENSGIISYIAKWIDQLNEQLENEPNLKDKINSWVQFNAFSIILRNANGVGILISETVGHWEGKELSKKLELEVGKDLQFIRINGTIVGGLVGLLIYFFTQLFN